MSSPEKTQNIQNSSHKPQKTSEKISLPSQKKQIPPQKFDNKIPNPSKTLYFQNLDPSKNIQKSNKNQAINIIDNVGSESDEELDEDIEIARKWLDNKKRKFEETHTKFQQNKIKIIETPTFEENSNDKMNEMKEIDEIASYNMFSQKNLWNLRSYLDKKLDDFPEKNEQKQSISQLQTKNFKEKPLRDDLSTPKPQKFMEEPIQYKQPSFIENSQLFSEKSNKSQKNENLLELFKDSLQKEMKNEINNSLKKLNFNEVLEEKIKEFIYIKDRVIQNEKSLKKSNNENENAVKNENFRRNNENYLRKSINEKENPEKRSLFKKKEKFVNKKCFYDEEYNKNNEYSVKPFDIKERINKINTKEIPIENSEGIQPHFVKNSQMFNKNSNNIDQNSQNSHKNVYNFEENSQNFERNSLNNDKTKEITSQNPQYEEEISELLNYNEDFYENGLFDLIDEIDNAEFIRSQSKNPANSFKKPLEKRINSQKTEINSLEEIIEENRNFTNNSYIESDVSINYIKKQINEMEESKRNKSKY